MEYEKDANFSNFTFDEDVTPSASMSFLAHEIIFTIFVIMGIFADITIIYVIFRFQRMRTSENKILGNWAISDLGSLLVAPCGYRLLSVMDNLPISPEFMCTLFHVGQMLQNTTMFFVLLILLDWFIAAHFEKTSQKFRSYQKYYLGAVWIFSILMSSVTTGYCISDTYSMFPTMLFIPLFFVVLIVVVVMQASRAVCRYYLKKPVEYSCLLLNIATAFPITYVLAFLTLILFNVVPYHPLIGMIAEIFLFCNSIVNLVILYNSDKDFQACFYQALRRGDKYEETLSFDNPIVNRVYDKCSVPIQISFKESADLVNNEVY